MAISPYIFPGLDPKVRPNKKRILSPMDILKIVADETPNVTVDNILSRRRFTNYVDSRQIFCYVMRNTFGYSFADTGRFISRDHATAIHSCKVHKDKFMFDRNYEDLTLRIMRKVNEAIEKTK